MQLNGEFGCLTPSGGKTTCVSYIKELLSSSKRSPFFPTRFLNGVAMDSRIRESILFKETVQINDSWFFYVMTQLRPCCSHQEIEEEKFEKLLLCCEMYLYWMEKWFALEKCGY